ncbi:MULTISPECIES: acyl-CoA dehydrogenase family protein [unclassified Streptomyces]|uniref:acyl-CoA dehydrogenase family protein n=1 Tax=unclassified Streptomyces TaxID=2593676 RepID=UPI002E0E3667|nr:acyl-CoA/acyl-ACP dehydrogenase [Streptomyces sp. NBC_01197]WSS51403.1 acyl-CoA/acyl-ACP dehydrogenase [Streptomyces sp. NBC_01180]
MSLALQVIDPEAALPAALVERLDAAAARSASNGRPDETLLAELEQTGLLGIAVPSAYGGSGGDATLINHVVAQVARVNPSAAIMLFQHYAVSARIAEWGDAVQQARLLPALAKGDLLAASGWSEPGAGAAKKRLNTTAVRLKDGRWRLNGAKSFTTSAGVAGLYLILARTSDSVDEPSGGYGSAGQTFFLVPAGNEGVRPDQSLDLVGMRGSATGFVSLHDCVVGDEDQLGPVGEATRLIAGVRRTGATLGAVSLGIASALLDLAVEQVNRRPQPPDGVTRFRLVDLATRIEATRAVIDRSGRRDAADPGLATLHSKLFASETAEQVGVEVARLLGSAGYVVTNRINRLMADARAVAHMGPTNDLCRELVSATWLG